MRKLKDPSFRPFVYGLCDPADPGHIRYVGMAYMSATRPYDHVKYAHRSSAKPSHRVHWIRKLLAEGRGYTVMILEDLPENSSRKFVGFVEKSYIASLRSIGHNLTNVASGGEGGGHPGYVWSAESKALLSAALKGKKKSVETRAAMTTARQAAWASGMYDSPETRAKLAQPRTDDWNEKNRQAHLGKTATNETKKEMSASQLIRYDDPIERKKTSDAGKAAWARRKAGNFTPKPVDVDKRNARKRAWTAKNRAWELAYKANPSTNYAQWSAAYDVSKA